MSFHLSSSLATDTIRAEFVRRRHNASLVTSFAGGMRLSISGWFRYGDPE